MSAIALVTLPFFALVLLGWVAAWRAWLPERAVPGLNAYVLYLALPCMLFRFGAGLPAAQLFNPGVLAVWLPAGLTVVALAVLATRRCCSLRDGAFGALVAAFPNSGFMGVPLLVALLGTAAAAPAIATVLIDMVITSTLCIALSQLQGAGAQGARQAAWRALRGSAANPLGWAIVAGGGASAAGLALPAPLQRVVGMLADSASPVALVTIGAVLWCARPQALSAAGHPPAAPAASASANPDHPPHPANPRHPVAPDGPAATVLRLSALKLLLHPALVAALGQALQRLGVALSDADLVALTLTAALPSASNVVLLAGRYSADAGWLARIVLASTSLAFFSFTALALWLGVQPAG